MSQFQRSRRHRSGGSLRRLLVCIAVLALPGAIAGCASTSADSGGAAGTTHVSFQLDWVKNSQFSGFFEADDAGYYSDEGLSASFLDGGDVASTAAVIAGGGAQLGIVSNMSRLADAIKAGADLVAVGALYQTSPAGIMTLPDRTVSTVDDLKGLRIGTDEAGEADIDTLFQVNDEQPDWTSVRVGYDAAPLFEHKIDAYYVYVTNQPVTYELKGKHSNVVTFADLGFKSYAGLIVTTRQYLDEHRDVVEGFLRATAKGWTTAIDSPEDAVDLTIGSYGSDLGLDKKTELGTLEAQIPLMQSDYTSSHGLLALDPAEIAGPMYDALRASGRTDLPDPATAFDTDILAQATSGGGS